MILRAEKFSPIIYFLANAGLGFNLGGLQETHNMPFYSSGLAFFRQTVFNQLIECLA
jgi:hypothetical protein